MYYSGNCTFKVPKDLLESTYKPAVRICLYSPCFDSFLLNWFCSHSHCWHCLQLLKKLNIVDIYNAMFLNYKHRAISELQKEEIWL